jgi:methyl-accepting chemotaxis protein
MGQGRERANSGVASVTRAGDALNRIAGAVTTINDLNTQVASATEQQSAVAEEINRSVVEIKGLAEQTGSGANQTAEASEELARLANRLQGLMGQFKT